LEKAKNHYESIEDFESCAKCKSLLDKINSKNSRVDNLHSSKSIVDSESIFKDNLTADEYHVINDNSSNKIKTPEAEDIIDKDGNVVYSSDGSFRKKKKMNKDSLKRQQLDNEYNKMLRERNLKENKKSCYFLTKELFFNKNVNIV
jgi:hypothetical protein